jgi:hypothetical protein
MRAVSMIGKVSGLCDSKARTSEEIERDLIAESQIVYPDLVFTLQKDSSKYCPPRARVEGERLVVFRDNIFLRAARDAGLEKMAFELEYNGKAFPAEQLMEMYGLELPKIPNTKLWADRFYFFKEMRVIPADLILGDFGEFIQAHSQNVSWDYFRHGCQGYRLKVCANEQKALEVEQKLLERLVKDHGRLRSIDGIRREDGCFKMFF